MLDRTDLTRTLQDAPVDPASAKAMADQGLDLRTFAWDSPDFVGFQQTVARGFLRGEPTPEQVETGQGFAQDRRFVAVYDATGPQPELPVGTFQTWVTEFSVPGGTAMPALAVSSVTVAPTHRRRGIARAMMEGELRTAATIGIPAACLTVSESTIYGRFGFAPAADGVTWKIDALRAGWAGPRIGGRVDYISREQFLAEAPAFHDRIRLDSPGEIPLTASHWASAAGVRPDAEKPGELRTVRYVSDHGATEGMAVFTISRNDIDFTKATLIINGLMTATPEAYASLWRFFLDHDLVAEVVANERSIDEPIRWLIADQRAATIMVTDHQYLRILDPAAALEARAYLGDDRIVVQVDDPLDIAGGRWVVDVTDGRATLTRDDTAVAEVSLSSRALAALYLGSTRARTLAAAGLIDTTGADRLDDLFRSRETARLSYWY